MYNPIAVFSRSELAGVNFNIYPTVYVSEAGVEKFFDWRAGDYTAKVAADTAKGIVVGSTISPPSVGAWVASKYFDFDSRAFGGSGGAAILAIETVGGGVYRVGGGLPHPTLPANFTGTVVEFDGPVVPVNFYAENGLEAMSAKRAWKMQHAPNHAGQILSGFHIQSTMHGSGLNGPGNASVGMSISSVKKNAALGTAAVGEIDSLYIVTRQGGPAPTSRQKSSDHAGILIDSTSYGNCGHGFGVEAAIRNIDPVSGAMLYSAQVQLGGMETNWAAFNADGSLNGNPLGVRFPFGFNAQLEKGSGGAAYIAQGPWAMSFTVNPVYEATPWFVSPGGTMVQGKASVRYFQRNINGVFSLVRADNATSFFQADQNGNIYSMDKKVLGPRRTGWAPCNDVEDRNELVSSDYSQVDINTVSDGLLKLIRQFNSLKLDLIEHGMIGE